MADKENKYHLNLACYFSGKSLYLDEPFRKKPSKRKLIEQPWQQTKAAIINTKTDIWDRAIQTLCNLNFIEAKCISGMTFDLMDDYALVLNYLPENQVKQEDELQQQERINRWNRELVEYSSKWNEHRNITAPNTKELQPKPQLPVSPPLYRLMSNEDIDKECQRIINNPSRFDKLNAFMVFIGTQSYPLVKYGEIPGFTLQHASSIEPSGVVHDAAMEILKDIKVPHFVYSWLNDTPHNPKPALIRTIENPGTGGVITSDGRHAVSSSFGEFRLWDLESGKCQKKLKAITFGQVSISSDGHYLITAGVLDRKVNEEIKGFQIFDLRKWQLLNTFEIQAFNPFKILITPDGGFACTIEALDKSESGMFLPSKMGVPAKQRWLRVWNLKNGLCLHNIELPDNQNPCLSMTPDGRLAVTVTSELKYGPNAVSKHSLCLWDLENGQCLRKFELDFVRSEGVSQVFLSMDGQNALTLGDGLRKWDLKTGECLQTIKEFGKIMSVTPNQRRAVSFYPMKVWDLETGQCLGTFDRTEKSIYSFLITPEGRRVVTMSQGYVKVWNIEDGQCIQSINKHPYEVTGLQISPDGKEAVSADKYSNEFRNWNLVNKHSRLIQLEKFYIRCTSYSPDGRNLVVAGNAMGSKFANIIQILDRGSDQSVQSFVGDNIRVDRLSITPDSTKMVLVCNDNILRVWDLKSGVELNKLEGHFSPISCLSISQDSKLAFTGGGGIGSSGNQDSDIRVWDLLNGKCLLILQDHTNFISCVKEIPDRRRIISGSWDHTIRVWDLKNGRCIHTLEKPTNSSVKSSIRCLSVTPDGHYAVSGGSMYGKMHLWDLESGQLVRDFIGHSGDIKCVDVTPNGQYVVSACADRTVRVWDLKNGECIALFCANAPIESLAIAPSSSTVVCGTTTGEVFILELIGISLQKQFSGDQESSKSNIIKKKWWKSS